MACLVLDTWAGRLRYPVEVVGETPKRLRVRILEPDGVMLPSRRFAKYGEVVLVPKYAVSHSREKTERKDA